MPVINQMAYNRQDTDSVSESFSLHFWVRSKAVNGHATGSDLYLFTSFSEVCICLGTYEDFPSYGQFQGMNLWATASFCILSLHEGGSLLSPLSSSSSQRPLQMTHCPRPHPRRLLTQVFPRKHLSLVNGKTLKHGAFLPSATFLSIVKYHFRNGVYRTVGGSETRYFSQVGVMAIFS